MSELTESAVWKKLSDHAEKMSRVEMRDMFDADPNRFERFSIKFDNFLFDYSKNIVNEETMGLLFELAEETGVRELAEKMFSGEKINVTENRAVLHVALRNRSDEPMKVDGYDVMPKVDAVLNQMRDFSEKVRAGEITGCTGMPFTDVVNIGIGGSDLGPNMVCDALKHYATPGLNVRFVSNVDGTHLHEVLKEVNPETTLFIIASKSFTTQETLTNAKAAREFFLKNAARHESDIAKHFVALSTNEKAVTEFGIDPKNMFGFWNWVGGRYSLWSAIGLSIAIYVGFDNFEKLLQGAHGMDKHFREAPVEKNIPIIMAMLGIWYSNFFDAATQAVVPYDQYLARFPAFLQQLDQESNGKRIDRNGKVVDYKTGPIVWGEPGTNAQHSFFQMIHQGTRLIPVDFLAPVSNVNKVGERHQILLSNFFAQTEALMKGRTEEEVLQDLRDSGAGAEQIEKLLPHKIFPGNKPTNSIMYDRMSPRTPGALIALYEHKVFVQGAVWNVNSFDQWGVELGKKLAKSILPRLGSDSPENSRDSSTNGLINYYKQNRD